LEIVVRQIDVECLPGDIPERIEVEVSDLGLNESIRVSDLPITAKVKVLNNPDQVVVHVVSVKEEAAAPTAAAPAEGEAAAAGTRPNRKCSRRARRKKSRRRNSCEIRISLVWLVMGLGIRGPNTRPRITTSAFGYRTDRGTARGADSPGMRSRRSFRTN
jgi:hypothetical protein